ncbi:hypothetical protein [Caulobacter endophyticus]|uniref:Uncharacterized protein n=1 Tax=Caulobacter endophyticus TaxID=2172652 RepID=A0A2T9JLH5_9CAUL|nr:hypothetical protein [Caulobacter endophyticus]PVM84555.1 hypothetical protein DDF67_18715 [Caulobacter endophyticus]
MIVTKTRLVAAALIALGVLYLAPTAYWIWSGARSGGPVTGLGVALNSAPGVLLLVAAATFLARPSRTIIAFWLAPLWAPILAFAWALWSRGPYPAAAAVTVAIVAYLVMLVVGLPLFAHLGARRRTGLGVTVVAGGLAAALVTGLGRALIVSAGEATSMGLAVEFGLDPAVLAMSAALGVAATASFWAIVRPDLKAA